MPTINDRIGSQNVIRVLSNASAPPTRIVNLTDVNTARKNEDGMLLHADNYCVEDLSSLMNAHKSRPKECLMTMLTFKSSNPSYCGIVSLNDEGIVIDFNEKKKGDFGNIANGAIYILSKDLIKIIKKDYSYTKDFSTEIIKNFLGKIYTYNTTKFFTDIGTLEEYEIAQRN